MRSTIRMAWPIVAASALISPGISSSQSKQVAASPAPVGEQVRRGYGLFNQNCATCHVPTKKDEKNPKDPGSSLGASQNGLFSGPHALPDDTARTFIKDGVPDKMPAFKYGLTTQEINEIIAYLKTLPLKPQQGNETVHVPSEQQE